MSTIAGDLVTTTASTATSINYAGQSQWVDDGKLDVPVSGQTGDYHLEDRSRYRVQDTESIQSLWANDAWTETGHSFSVDQEAHDAQAYNQTINLPKNSECGKWCRFGREKLEYKSFDTCRTPIRTAVYPFHR